MRQAGEESGRGIRERQAPAAGGIGLAIDPSQQYAGDDVETMYVAAIAIVAIGVLVVVALNRGRLESIGIDWGKAKFAVKTRPDPVPTPAPSGIQLDENELDGRSSLSAPANATLSATKNKLSDGSRISIRDPKVADDPKP